MEVKENIEEIIGLLSCESIPDTRALQTIRLDSVGKLDDDEGRIRKYKDEAGEPYKKGFLKLWNQPRIVRLPEEEERRLYSLAIPFSFPLGDSLGEISYKEKSFFRFQGPICGNSALHLTTNKGFNELVKILVNNDIPIEFDKWQIWTPFEKTRSYPAIKVPHKWHNHDDMLYHCFATLEQDVMACPFWYVEELNLSHSVDEFIKTFSVEANEKKYHVDSHFFSSKHGRQPEQHIPEYIEERTKRRIGEEFRCGVDLIIEEAKSQVLKVGEPVKVYDPSWIKV